LDEHWRLVVPPAGREVNAEAGGFTTAKPEPHRKGREEREEKQEEKK
jgi:hypothetical protein